MKLQWMVAPLMALAITPASAEVDQHARLLAASCAACHGTNGNSVGGTAVLAGMDKGLFVKAMTDFRSGERKATVMHRHAKGLTEDEIDKLGDFFAAQKRGR